MFGAIQRVDSRRCFIQKSLWVLRLSLVKVGTQKAAEIPIILSMYGSVRCQKKRNGSTESSCWQVVLGRLLQST